MKILVACEESQRVTIELRKLGHEAYSCDIQESSGGSPQWHILGDAIEEAYSGKYDMMIAFPPCTHICISGAKHFKQKIADGRQQKAVEFFMKLVRAPINQIAIENPIGIMSRIYRKPDQIIHPFQFGDEARKSTCLWLKNLPLLKPTKIVSQGEMHILPDGRKIPKWYSNNRKAIVRSKTFMGIARAMANQWSNTEYMEQLRLF